MIARILAAIARARANARPHPDEAAVLARGRAAHLEALDHVHSNIARSTR